MEKVTVYGSVRPGRGERLPRVDFTESSCGTSSPFDGPLSDRTLPALQPTRRRSTRLLPNLRYISPCDDEGRTAPCGQICPQNRQCRQASVLAVQQDYIPSKLLASRRVRSEALSVAAPIGKEGSLAQTAAVPLSSSASLNSKVAASKSRPRPSNARSVATKPKPPRLQKQTLPALPKPKHKKTLAAGRQIKTHLRCEHVPLGPIWGGATTTQQEQDSDDHLTKREAFERRRIARKIDALCAASAGKGDSRGQDDRKGKRGRDEEGEEGSPPAAKQNKLMASRRQHETHPRAQLLSTDQRPITARPLGALAVDSHDEEEDCAGRRMVSTCDSTDEDGNKERRRSFTRVDDTRSKRKKVVLKSNIKTPRNSQGNVYEEADPHSPLPGGGTRTENNPSYGDVAENYDLSQREDYCNNCDCSGRRSFRYNKSDCSYCREDTYHSLCSCCKFCACVGCSRNSHADVDSNDPKHARSSTRLDHRSSEALDQPCPMCINTNLPTRDGRWDVSRGCYQNVCRFCGMVFNKSALPAVSDDDDLRHRSDCHYCGHTRSGSRSHCDERQRTREAEHGGPLGRPATVRPRTPTHRTGLRVDPIPTRPRPEASACPIGEARASALGRGQRSHGRPPTPRQESRGIQSTDVQFTSRFSGDDAYKSAAKRTRFATDETIIQDKCSGHRDERYHRNYSSTDGGDKNIFVGPFRGRSSVGSGILKNSKLNSSVVTNQSSNLLQNVDSNSMSFMAQCVQLKGDLNPLSDVGISEVDHVSSSDRSLINKQRPNVRSRNENRRQSSRQGTEKVTRVIRDPAHSLVLDDHL